MRVEVKGDELYIDLPDRFTFAEYGKLKQIYESYPASINYALNFADTTYMDSSGLGALLSVRAHNKDGTCRLINCNKAILQILTIANFHMMFKINVK